MIPELHGSALDGRTVALWVVLVWNGVCYDADHCMEIHERAQQLNENRSFVALT
jgi:predicted DNA-binding helix-hairpin-helix protein